MKAPTTSKVSALIFVGVGSLALLTIALWPRAHRTVAHKSNVVLPPPTTAERRSEAVAAITKYKAKPDPKSQDMAGEAEMRLAYLDAGDNNFEASRKLFLDATKVKGTGAMSADYGGVNDQAAYQAAVCLVAENKPEEAKKAFRTFLREHQLSPWSPPPTSAWPA